MAKKKKNKPSIGGLTRMAEMVAMNPTGFRKPPKNKKSRKRKKTLVEEVDQKIKDYERKI